MADSTTVNFEMRARAAIARRQWRARVARWLLFPLVIVVGYLVHLDHVNAWIGIAGLGLVGVIIVLNMIAVQQQCPRCETLLTRRHWWGEEFLATCPSCEAPID